MSEPGDSPDRYRRPCGTAEAEERILRSRFLARVLPLREPDGAQALLDPIRREEHKATHHCWAWRCGHPDHDPASQSSDDGEPSGSAGLPILQAIEACALSDALVVVTRWYGGVKLGTGGLVRAYGGVARQALAEVPVEEAVLVDELRLRFDYPLMTRVLRLLQAAQASEAGRTCAEDVELRARVPRSAVGGLKAELAELFQGRGEIA